MRAPSGDGRHVRLLNGVILLRRENLLRESLPLARRRQIFNRAASGSLPYIFAVGVAFVSAYASLAICAAIGVFYALPIASGYESGRRLTPANSAGALD